MGRPSGFSHTIPCFTAPHSCHPRVLALHGWACVDVSVQLLLGLSLILRTVP